MGFFSSVNSGLSKVGSFVGSKVLPAIGKVAGVVRRVGEFGQSGVGKTFLNGATYLPVIGTAAKWLQTTLPSITAGAGIVEDATRLGSTVLQNPKLADMPSYGKQAFDLFNRGNELRGSK